MNIKGSGKYKHFFVDRDNRVAYLNIPKCGCTTIKAVVCGFEGGENPTKLDYEPYRRTVKEIEDAKIYRFTFVRNPVSRFMSFYNDKIVRWDKNIASALNENGFYYGMSLDEAIEVVERVNPEMLEPHARPMTKIVFNQHGTCVVDFVGRLERFAEDFLQITNRIGIEQYIEKRNQSKLSASIGLSANHLSRLIRVYEDDIDAFGYSFTSK